MIHHDEPGYTVGAYPLLFTINSEGITLSTSLLYTHSEIHMVPRGSFKHVEILNNLKLWIERRNQNTIYIDGPYAPSIGGIRYYQIRLVCPEDSSHIVVMDLFARALHLSQSTSGYLALWPQQSLKLLETVYHYLKYPTRESFFEVNHDNNIPTQRQDMAAVHIPDHHRGW